VTEEDRGTRPGAPGAEAAPEQGPQASARSRIEALLDAGSFVELDGLAGARDPGARAVVGLGTIDGRDVALYALVAGSGGSLGEATAAKIVKIQELALRSRIPIAALDDSGPRTYEGLTALAGHADICRRHVRASGVVPQLSVVLGPGTGAAAHTPALSDFVVAASGTGAWGAPEAAHFLVEDEAACWRTLRALLSHLPSHSGEAPPFLPTADPPDRADPALQALAARGAGRHRDAREVVARVLDEGRFLEVQPSFAENVLVGFGRLGGHVAGVVANQPAVRAGAIDAAASGKAARFVRFCDAFNVPLVSLVDTPGSAAGAAHGVALLRAYARATVPRLTVITGRATGDAYGLMSPRQLGADLSLAWPSAEIAEAGSGPYAAAERGYVDDVIEPRETRRALVRGLELCLRRTAARSSRDHDGIPL
jgi:propionyl-CoA carboxylase beta chain